jgi:dCTP deaminase
VSVLSDREILDYVENGYIGVSPFYRENIGPASLDLVLANRFLVPHARVGSIRMDEPIEYDEVVTDRFTLNPGDFVLAASVERIRFPARIAGCLAGRSSIGRLGLFVENAAWFDPGFDGNATLELSNANRYPIVLDAGRRICQMVFWSLAYPAENPYSGKYRGVHATGAVGSRIYEDHR